MKTRRKRKREVGLQTTVMVDILFILLIFFILVSQIKSDRINVKLPKVDKQKKTKPRSAQSKHKYSIAIDKDNHIFWNGTRLASFAELARRLQVVKTLVDKGQAPLILLKTDKNSQSGTLIKIVNLISETGLQKVQFDVQ